MISRHVERDRALPEYREQLLNRAVTDLQADSDVLAIYLAGSLAKGNADRYSDIDLHTVVKPEKRAAFIENKQDRPQRWGNVLFCELSSPQSPIVVVHFDCFVKMDTWYHSPDDLQPSLWFQGNQPLYDPKGMVQSTLAASRELAYLPDAAEVARWRGKVLAYIHETYRATMRQDLYYALSMLNHFRWMIAYGWYMESGRRVDSAPLVWSKFEGERSHLKEWQLSLLASWTCDRDARNIFKTVSSMIPEFLRLNRSLCQTTGLPEDRERCLHIIEMVL